MYEARAAFYADKPLERRFRPFTLRMGDAGVLGAPGADSGGTLAPATPTLAPIGMSGYASTTEDPYTVSDWLGDYTETICRGAFTKALQERQDVRLLVNHEGIPIARTKSGTMNLREDDSGLFVDVPSLDGDSPLVQTVRSAMMRGDVDEMSFAFKATRQEWNEDYTERFVREVKLYDVSVVTYPANAGTSVKLRSGLPAGTVERLMAGAPLTEKDVEAIRAALPREEERADTHTDEVRDDAVRRLAQLKALAASL